MNLPTHLPFLEIRSLGKAYGGIPALADVSLTLQLGELHALMGENGAGKSTLIKCVSGAVRPDQGEVCLDGRPIATGDIRAAEAAGIAALHQEATAFPHLDAIDNLFVGREPRRFGGLLNRPQMRREAQALMERLGERIDLTRPLETLPLAQRQMVGIARALSRRSRLLILDEPTASLSARETQVLFRILRQLQSEGVAILYISHRLEEVFALADRVTVLRDGCLVETRPIAEVTSESLVRMMVGRELLSTDQGRSGASSSADTSVEQTIPALQVQGLTRTGEFQDISFAVRGGEIVGLAGLVGAGRSEVAATIFGIERPTDGRVTVNGKPLGAGSVRTAIARGIALVPEDRQQQGLVLPLSVGDNLLLAVMGSLAKRGFRAFRTEKTLVARFMQELAVKAAGPAAPAGTLSGGNQQKVALGKWLASSPRILILDEPTRGVDVGAKAEVYRLIRTLANQGMATLLISSDLPEILALSDRVLVMRQGHLAGELMREEASEEKILALALPDGPGGEASPPNPPAFGAKENVSVAPVVDDGTTNHSVRAKGSGTAESSL